MKLFNLSELTTGILLLIIGGLVAISGIVYICNIYKLYKYTRPRKYKFKSEFEDIMGVESISDDYKWFTSNERSLMKIPFSTLDNNQSIIFKISATDSKYVSVGSLSDNFKVVSQCITRRGSFNLDINVSRNLSVSSIGESRDLWEKIITSTSSPIIYIEHIGPNPIEISKIERRTYTTLTSLPDPTTSLIIPHRISFDKENVEVDSIHSIISTASNHDRYKFENKYQVKPIYSEDFTRWLDVRDTELPFPNEVDEPIGSRGSCCFGDFVSRFISNRVDGKIVVYHIDHTMTGKAEYVRLSLIDDNGEEIFKTDSVDWTNGKSETTYIGGKVCKTTLAVPMGVKGQLLESIYGPPLPYVGSVFPMSIFNYTEVSKNL